jgi:hypothetical protein
VKEDEQILGAAVQHAVEAVPIMAAQLPQLALHLGGMGEWEGRTVLGAKVQAIDLVLNHHPSGQRVQRPDKVSHRLRPVGSS